MKVAKPIKTELISNFIKANNLSKTALCRLCKISYGTLNKILSGKANLRVVALVKIAKVIGVKFNSLFA